VGLVVPLVLQVVVLGDFRLGVAVVVSKLMLVVKVQEPLRVRRAQDDFGGE